MGQLLTRALVKVEIGGGYMLEVVTCMLNFCRGDGLLNSALPASLSACSYWSSLLHRMSWIVFPELWEAWVVSVWKYTEPGRGVWMIVIAVVTSRPSFLSAAKICRIFMVVLKSCIKFAFATQFNWSEPGSGVRSNTHFTKILHLPCPCHYQIIIFECLHYFCSCSHLFTFS